VITNIPTTTTAADPTIAAAYRIRWFLGATTRIGAATKSANCWDVIASPSSIPAQIHCPHRAHANPANARPIAIRSSGWKYS
jgi:hypothetical protein